eukprot:3698255-Karenia_brevis.AAC.1
MASRKQKSVDIWEEVLVNKGTLYKDDKAEIKRMSDGRCTANVRTLKGERTLVLTGNSSSYKEMDAMWSYAMQRINAYGPPEETQYKNRKRPRQTQWQQPLHTVVYMPMPWWTHQYSNTQQAPTHLHVSSSR